MPTKVILIGILFFILATNNGFSKDEPMRLAIMDLQAQGVSAQTAATVSDILRTELVNTGLFTIIERKEMGNILKEQSFQLSGCSDTECAVQIGKLLSARKIMVGTVSKLGNAYIINARIVDVEKGVADFAENTKVSSESDLDTGCATFAMKLAERISGQKPKVTVYPFRTVGYISAGVCLVSLGAGILINHTINNNNTQIDSLYTDYLSATSGFDTAWNAYNDKINSNKNLITERNIFYIASGVTGAFGIVSIFFIKEKVNNIVSFEISPGQIKLAYRF